ncbi:MAG TPA: DUF4410 domain-containing protein [Urbifossiella sp.]
MKVLNPCIPIVTLALAGCASVSVHETHSASATVRKPALILVEPFDTSSGRWQITSRRYSNGEFEQRAAAALQADLVKDLNRFAGRAASTASHAAVPPNAWVVGGRFVHVSEGSPFGRITIGLGLGASKVETDTFVRQPSVGKKPFLEFTTSGGSNAMPGVIFSTSPWGAAFTTIGQARLGVADDANRTSRMITGEILDYMVRRGWLQKTSLHAKKAGEFQVLQPQASPAKDKTPL